MKNAKMRNGRWLSVLYVTRVLNGSDRRTIYEPAIEYARKEIVCVMRAVFCRDRSESALWTFLR